MASMEEIQSNEEFATITQSPHITNKNLEKVNDLMASLKLEREKYFKNKLLHEVIRECSEEPHYLDKGVASKIRDILLSASCMQKNRLKEGATLLGVLNEQVSDLNYDEADKLVKVVSSQLKNKYTLLRDTFKKHTNKNLEDEILNLSDKHSLSLTSEDETAINLKLKLVQKQAQYVKNLLEEFRIMEQILNVRLQEVPQKCNEKIQEVESLINLNLQKSYLMQTKTNIDIFKEHKKSLEAYRALLKDIKEQQNDCTREIEELKDLKEKYKQVQCKEYDEILKSYIDYKNTIEKRKRLLL